jgi:hypothetical protein
VALPPGSAPTSLLRAETRAREAAWAAHKGNVGQAGARVTGPAYELRVGDLKVVWDDIADCSLDAAVVDPPYDDEGIPIFEDLARLLARVLKSGRLAAIYCGHMRLDDELRLLEEGGLTYVWHGVNVLPGRHTKIRSRRVNGRHRSVLLFSAGSYRSRRWLHDTFLAELRGEVVRRPGHCTSGSKPSIQSAIGCRWCRSPARWSSIPAVARGRPVSPRFRRGVNSSEATSIRVTSKPPVSVWRVSTPRCQPHGQLIERADETGGSKLSTSWSTIGRLCRAGATVAASLSWRPREGPLPLSSWALAGLLIEPIVSKEQ